MRPFAGLSLVWLLSAAVLAAKEDAGTVSGDVLISVTLQVGETYAVCESGTGPCPALGPICDDRKVATASDGGRRGLLWQAVGPGTTLCSVGPTGQQGAGRRLYRITVK